MKILLLNDNPVVNKLVTLSAQKTSDELVVISNLDDLDSQSCDLLVVDDTIFNDNAWQDIKSKINFKKSLYICAKNAEVVDDFTATLRKPFLPTDLVELFSNLGKGMDAIKNETPAKIEEESDFNEIALDEIEDLDFHEISLDNELSLDDDLILEDLSDITSLSNELSAEELEEELSLDSLDGDLSFDDDFTESLQEESTLDSLDDLKNDALSFDDEEEELLMQENENSSILDKDDLQEVKELLKEEPDNFDLDDELDSFGFEDDLAPADEKEIEELLSDIEDEEIDGLEEFEKFDTPEKKVEENLELEDDLESLGIEDKSELEDDLTSLGQDDALEDDLETDADEIEELLNDIQSEESKDLEELEDEDTDLDDILKELDNEFEEELDLEEKEVSDELESEESLEPELEEELDLEKKEVSDEFESENSLEHELEEALEDDLDDLTIEDQIQKAVEELSDEDLESELDESTLLDIDSLTSRDLKLAIGEEVEEEAQEELEETEAEGQEESSEDFDLKEKQIQNKEFLEDTDEGVESLKKLLTALSNHDVAASLKGMKISINITLGDKE